MLWLGKFWVFCYGLGMGWLHDVVDLIMAAGALLAAYTSLRNASKIQEVHLLINSRMNQLLAATGLAARAEGAAAERKEAQARGDDRGGTANPASD
jgi:hypothetical protein